LWPPEHSARVGGKRAAKMDSSSNLKGKQGGRFFGRNRKQRLQDDDDGDEEPSPCAVRNSGYDSRDTVYALNAGQTPGFGTASAQAPTPGASFTPMEGFGSASPAPAPKEKKGSMLTRAASMVPKRTSKSGTAGGDLDRVDSFPSRSIPGGAIPTIGGGPMPAVSPSFPQPAGMPRQQADPVVEAERARRERERQEQEELELAMAMSMSMAEEEARQRATSGAGRATGGQPAAVVPALQAVPVAPASSAPHGTEDEQFHAVLELSAREAGVAIPTRHTVAPAEPSLVDFAAPVVSAPARQDSFGLSSLMTAAATSQPPPSAFTPAATPQPPPSAFTPAGSAAAGNAFNSFVGTPAAPQMASPVATPQIAMPTPPPGQATGTPAGAYGEVHGMSFGQSAAHILPQPSAPVIGTPVFSSMPMTQPAVAMAVPPSAVANPITPAPQGFSMQMALQRAQPANSAMPAMPSTPHTATGARAPRLTPGATPRPQTATPAADPFASLI